MAILSGLARIGNDVELKYTADGMAVINISLAFNYGKKQDNGYRQTQWIEAAFFGKRAESLSQYLKKGGLVSVVINDPHVDYFTKKDGTQGVKFVGSILEIELVSDQSKKNNEHSTEQKQSTQNNQNNQDDFDDGISF